MPPARHKWANVAGAVSAAALIFFSFAARGEIVEEVLQMPTDGAGAMLMPMNPAMLRLKGVEGGAQAFRDTRTTVLDHSQQPNGSKITSKVNDDFVAGAALVDLGAGAGLGISHQIQFRKVDTQLDGRRNSTTEVEEVQHSAAKVVIELTDEFHAAMSVRYMQVAETVFGDPTLGAGMETRYKTTFIGYGSGFSYITKNGGVGYVYFPPLHGKTDTYGEERIVSEQGLVGLEGFFSPNDQVTLGIMGRHYLNEIDDRALGTTAADNTTKISFMGLDPDQYLVPKQLIMVGVDFGFNKQAALRLAVGQESDSFDFTDFFNYRGVGVRQRGDDDVKTTKAKAALRFGNQGAQLDAGVGMYTRKYDFPENENAGSYKTDGRELFVAVDVKL